MPRKRRSVDAGFTELMPEANSTFNNRKPSRIPIAFISILSTFAIALAILAGFRQHESPHGLDVFTDAATEADDIFTLHPADHASRAPTTTQQEWRITSGMRRPDGVLKRVYLINDKFPGPTLEVRSGDRLVVRIENALEDNEGVSIHWHGLSMRAANAMDGAAGVTQSHIQSNETQSYDFEIQADQHGTFWYHAHDGVQRADGLYGGLVVHEPLQTDSEPPSTVEKLLLIGDWYHRTAIDALDFYMHPGSFGNEPVPDSMLLNGQGVFDCNDSVPARPLDCDEREMSTFPTIKLDASEDSVLRIVNVGAYAGISITVAGSLLTPLMVDGGNRVHGPPAQTVGYIHPGERVDFLVQSLPDQPSTSYLGVSLDTTPFKISDSALTSVRRYPIQWTNTPHKTAEINRDQNERFDLENLKPQVQQLDLLPDQADHTIVLYAMTQKLSHLGNIPHGFINNTYWNPEAKSLNTMHQGEWDEKQLVPHIPYDPAKPLWVDIVLNNLDEEGHPFHLHGYDLWVLSKYSSSFNWGSYNPFGSVEPPGGPYDLANALRKDTVYVPRRGYAVLRFRADNPG